MSKLSLVELKQTVADSPGVDLGPGTVTQILPRAELEVRLENGVLRTVRCCFPLPYEAVVGDELLVLSNARGAYAVAVLVGQGCTKLEVEGDLQVRARGGSLTLGADQEVRLEAPKLTALSRSLSVLADTVLQHAGTLRQRITDLYELHAGTSRTSVDGQSYSQAESTTVLAKENVVINSKAIHLG